MQRTARERGKVRRKRTCRRGVSPAAARRRGSVDRCGLRVDPSGHRCCRRAGRVRPVGGGSSVGQSRGLIILGSWVRAPPAPPVCMQVRRYERNLRVSYRCANCYRFAIALARKHSSDEIGSAATTRRDGRRGPCHERRNWTQALVDSKPRRECCLGPDGTEISLAAIGVAAEPGIGSAEPELHLRQEPIAWGSDLRVCWWRYWVRIKAAPLNHVRGLDSHVIG